MSGKLYKDVKGLMRLPVRGLHIALCLFVTFAVIITLPACSTKKNTAASRQWQAFNTRYNVYFNGSEHYREQLADMERDYEDDYSRHVLMHPAEARADEKLTQPKGDFKRTIEKMQKAIQLHSIKKKPAKRTSSPKDKEFRAREEYNPFLHNAWLMMGRAQYLNGDFMGAASTFMYITRHFKWMPDVVTEAMLWQARSYIAMDWAYEAENVLTRVKPKMLTTKSLQNLYDFVQADYLVHAKQYEEALPYLQRAAKAASGSQKNRIWFLLGQVYSELGRKNEAYQAFSKVGSGNGTTYRTKFNARIKQSEVYTGTNINSEVRALRGMTRYERNREYLDQIYYAIGNLYLSRRDTANAKKNYELAIEKSTRDGIDKALAQVSLGNILFSEREYVKAQPCYSEAVPKLPETFPDYKMLKRRSDVLDELAVYAGNVELQDSLLKLSMMPEEEQLKICNRLAEELKKKEKEEAEEAKRAEYMAQVEAAGSQMAKPGGANAPTQFQINSDKSWYFYNQTTKNAGKTEFQKKWGSRRLEDDWRRRNKTTFAIESEDTNSDDETGENTVAANDSITPEEQKKLNREQDPHYPEYYMRQIPKTDEERLTCTDIIQEGLYNMGVILKDKLEDFSAASTEFETLLRRFPDNIYRLDVYYNMYLMAVRRNDADRAEYWRKMILDNFPESAYGQAMQDPAYFDNLKRMHEIQADLYDDAYKAYLENDNTLVHKLTDDMEKDFPLSDILPKFVFIDALSYLTEKDYDKFQQRLTTLLEKWPDTDMTPMAGSILKGLKEGRKPNAGMQNNRGMLWEIRLSADTTASGSGASTPARFDLDPNKPQTLVLAFPLDSVSANALLYDVARFNFGAFVVRDFDLEQMNFGRIGLLIIKGFDNMRQLEHYRTVMERDPDFKLPPEVRPIMISVANFELLLREGRSFDEYFRFEAEAPALAIEQQEQAEEGEQPVEEPNQENPDEIGENQEESAPAEPEQTEPEEPTEPAQQVEPTEESEPENNQ